MNSPANLHKRIDDQPPESKIGQALMAVRAWWIRWGQLVVGLWLLVVSAGLFGLAALTYGQKTATDDAAQLSCDRARIFGPYFAVDYEARGVLPPALLERYRATIPKDCP